MERLYKAFNCRVNDNGEPELYCLSKTYKPGVLYKERKVEICRSGMHACRHPLDCFNFYSTKSVVWEVEGEVVAEHTVEDDSGAAKVVCSKLRLLAPYRWKDIIIRNQNDIGRICDMSWGSVKEILLANKKYDIWSSVLQYYLWYAFQDSDFDLSAVEFDLRGCSYIKKPHNSDSDTDPFLRYLITKSDKPNVAHYAVSLKLKLSEAMYLELEPYFEEVQKWYSVPRSMLIDKYLKDCKIAYLKRILDEGLFKDLCEAPNVDFKQLKQELWRCRDYINLYNLKLAIEYDLLSITDAITYNDIAQLDLPYEYVNEVIKVSHGRQLELILDMFSLQWDHVPLLLEQYPLQGWSVELVSVFVNKFLRKIPANMVGELLRHSVCGATLKLLYLHPDPKLIKKYLSKRGTLKWFNEIKKEMEKNDDRETI